MESVYYRGRLHDRQQTRAADGGAIPQNQLRCRRDWMLLSRIVWRAENCRALLRQSLSSLAFLLHFRDRRCRSPCSVLSLHWGCSCRSIATPKLEFSGISTSWASEVVGDAGDAHPTASELLPPNNTEAIGADLPQLDHCRRTHSVERVMLLVVHMVMLISGHNSMIKANLKRPGHLTPVTFPVTFRSPRSSLRPSAIPRAVLQGRSARHFLDCPIPVDQRNRVVGVDRSDLLDG